MNDNHITMTILMTIRHGIKGQVSFIKYLNELFSYLISVICTASVVQYQFNFSVYNIVECGSFQTKTILHADFLESLSKISTEDLNIIHFTITVCA